MAVAVVLALLLPCLPAAVFAQDEPLLTIDEDCPVFAFAPDGRIAYAVRRIITERRLDMQRDDVWVTTLGGQKKRIINGEKLFPRSAPVSYAIQSLRWSPDGTRLIVEMIFRQMVDADGETKEAALVMLFDDNGKEIKIEGGGNTVQNASNAAWLGDGVTLAYLTEAARPRLLFALNTVRPVAGRASRLFERSAFAAMALDAKRQVAVAIERDATLSGPPRLVWLDLQKQTRRLLAELTGYVGMLTLTPSATTVAYFADHETLEIRKVDAPEQVTRVRVVLGPYQWAPDETRILIKRGAGKRSSDLRWIRLPGGEPEPVLHGLSFWDFELSSDGRHLAVTVPGKRVLKVFSVN